MKTVAIFALLGAGSMGISATAQGLATPAAETTPAGPAVPPLLLGQSLFAAGQFSEFEKVVGNYIRFDTREADGTQALWYLTYGLDNWLQYSDDVDDHGMAERFEAWRRQFPESALEPIVAAMYARASAWRGRGSGYASTVTPEGWRLYEERNQRAWKILMESEARSTKNPMWYHEAIYIGGDLKIPRATLRELFDEGLRKYPDYYAIYSAYMRLFAPLWGGDWKSADKFIVEQTAAKSDKKDDTLYARLYWYVDEYNARSSAFFDESLADWPRMRRGFDQLMVEHPRGARNHAAFAAFACRANDAITYARLRSNIDRGYFREVAPRGVSVEMCDARFKRPT